MVNIEKEISVHIHKPNCNFKFQQKNNGVEGEVGLGWSSEAFPGSKNFMKDFSNEFSVCTLQE